MQLLDIYNLFQLENKNFYTTFDQLNNNTVTYDLPVIVAQFEKASAATVGFLTYTFTVGYVDRIDGSLATGDPAEVATRQSEAIVCLQGIIDRFTADRDSDFEIRYGDIIPFQQRFDALTAGAYLTIEITVPAGCGD